VRGSSRGRDHRAGRPATSALSAAQSINLRAKRRIHPCSPPHLLGSFVIAECPLEDVPITRFGAETQYWAGPHANVRRLAIMETASKAPSHISN